MRATLSSLAALAALGAALGHASAQSVTTAVITGTVSTEVGAPISGAFVTFSLADGGEAREIGSDVVGRFTTGPVPPGSYRLRVEAIGYRPLVAGPITVTAGQRRSVELRLVAATPPVVSVDTIAFVGAGSIRFRPAGVDFTESDVRRVPDRFESLASLAQRSPSFAEDLGARGLPGDLTQFVADGIPFRRAPHPASYTDPAPIPLLAVSSVSLLELSHDPANIEWAEHTGSVVSLSTVAPSAGSVQATGGYSGDPVWSSSVLDLEAPGMTSWQAGARGTLGLGDGGSRLTVAGEAIEHQGPLEPRLTELDGLTDLSPEEQAALTEPSVESYSRFSGLARFETTPGAGSHLMVRAAAASSKREATGPGWPALGSYLAPAEESLEFSAAGVYVTQIDASLLAELRAGISGSYRDFGTEALAPAVLADTGERLGEAPGAQGTSDRTDVFLAPSVVHSTLGRSTRLGALLRTTSHSMGYTDGSLGTFAFSDQSAATTGEGYGEIGRAPEVSFRTGQAGVFVQHDMGLGSGLRASVGGRYDYEILDLGELAANAAWAATSGLDNVDAEDGLHQFGALASLVFEPRPGSTTLALTAALSEGDLDTRALYELLSQDVDATMARHQGSGLDWPAGEVPATPLPMLTLFGPDTRAPRTLSGTASLTQPVAGGLAFSASGTFRRTDFLLRRRDLNRPVAPLATDAYGRDVWGTLAKTGRVVSSTADDGRRFPAFGPVWALDPDGWSEYLGVTVGLEQRLDAWQLFGWYTYSQTTDNWLGARTGRSVDELPPLLPTTEGGDEWSEGTSDFDVPHRLGVLASLTLFRVTLTGSYRYASGRPFTPGYGPGLDANGDGSGSNDVAFVVDDPDVAALFGAWPCLEDGVGAFAERNACRGPDRHGLDARLDIDLGNVGGLRAHLLIDAFNLVESEDGVIDEALLLADPAAPIATGGSTVTVPVIVNENFGSIIYPATRGRTFRFGLRIGR